MNVDLLFFDQRCGCVDEDDGFFGMAVLVLAVLMLARVVVIRRSWKIHTDH